MNKYWLLVDTERPSSPRVTIFPRKGMLNLWRQEKASQDQVKNSSHDEFIPLVLDYGYDMISCLSFCLDFPKMMDWNFKADKFFSLLSFFWLLVFYHSNINESLAEPMMMFKRQWWCLILSQRVKEVKSELEQWLNREKTIEEYFQCFVWNASQDQKWEWEDKIGRKTMERKGSSVWRWVWNPAHLSCNFAVKNNSLMSLPGLRTCWGTLHSSFWLQSLKGLGLQWLRLIILSPPDPTDAVFLSSTVLARKQDICMSWVLTVVFEFDVFTPDS